MRSKFQFSLLLLCIMSVTRVTQSAIVWQVGRDDGGWPAGDGGGPDTSFLQENAAENALPGDPVTAFEGPFGADNDYYFSGVYNTVLPGNGSYTPVGVVAANEEGAERAFSAADNDLRFHFNLTPADLAGNLLFVTFDPFNLDQGEAGRPVLDPRYGIEVYFNGVQVMSQLIIRPAQLNTKFRTPLFSPTDVDARSGPGFDNIVSLRGINYNSETPGGGNWMGIDFVQLDSQPIPEPSSALMLLFGALGVAPFLRRRRA